ncbi:MAG: aminopeptidase P family protein [Chloroflexi bacterium]|nr:aminopeptidase P family protein [Chloroflexota bacterium]
MRLHGFFKPVVLKTSAYLAVDPRYHERAQTEARDCQIFPVPPQTAITPAILRLAADLGLRTLAFEAHHITVAAAEEMRASAEPLGLTLIPTTNVIEQQRTVKDAGELALLERASLLTDQAMQYAISYLRLNITEQELAWEIESFIRTHGGEGVSFPPIVAFGENGARPHPTPTIQRLKNQEAILIDIGATVDGYCGDLTRTYWLGNPPPQFRQYHHAVLETLSILEQEIHSGLTGAQIDARAHEILGQYGLEQFLTHSAGHAIGLEVHEHPHLSQRDQAPILPGTVITLEPAVYLPRWGGIRIEDTVVMTEGGCRVLNHAPKSLTIGAA